MSSFLCFVCHSTVNEDTSEDIREKYREVIGMNLCPDSQLCFICCHFLNKMCLFRSICLKRSLEYPVLFSERGTINLQKCDTQIAILCPEDLCMQHLNSRHHINNNNNNSQDFEMDDKYDHLHYDRTFFNQNEQTSIYDEQNDKQSFFSRNDDSNFFAQKNDSNNFGQKNDAMFLERENEWAFLNDKLNLNVQECVEKEFFSHTYRGNEELDSFKDIPIEACMNIETVKCNQINFVDAGCQTDQINNTINNPIIGDNNLNNGMIIDTSINTVVVPDTGQNFEINCQESIAINLTDNVFNKDLVIDGTSIINNREIIENANNYPETNIFENKDQEHISNDDNEKNNYETNINNISKTINIIPNNETMGYFEIEPVKQNYDIQEKNEIESNNELEHEINLDGINDCDENMIENDCYENESSDSDHLNDRRNDFSKITLSVEEQKSELESNRKTKKYVEAVFKCHSCALGFLLKDSYQAHMMRHEESNGEYRCSICTLRFANPAVLRSHLANHSERYKCTDCGDIVRSRQRQTHIVACRGTERTGVTCHLCGNIFQGVSHFQQHLKRFHNTKQSSRTYPCNVCGKIFKNQAAVRSHLITHINKKFLCDICNSTFSSPYTLNQHKKKHNTESELHYCETCKIGYTSRKSLLAHLKNALAHKNTVYKCQICDRSCPTLKSLQNHISSIHERSKNLYCNMCPARYSTRKALVRHISSHRSMPSIKPRLCHSCGESFKSTSKLKRHLKNVCEKDKLEDICNYYG